MHTPAGSTLKGPSSSDPSPTNPVALGPAPAQAAFAAETRPIDPAQHHDADDDLAQLSRLSQTLLQNSTRLCLPVILARFDTKREAGEESLFHVVEKR